MNSISKNNNSSQTTRRSHAIPIYKDDTPVANQQNLGPSTSKMAPWPEQGNEPKAPDKNSDDSDNVSMKADLRNKIRNTAVTVSDIPEPMVQEFHDSAREKEIERISVLAAPYSIAVLHIEPGKRAFNPKVNPVHNDREKFRTLSKPCVAKLVTTKMVQDVQLLQRTVNEIQPLPKPTVQDVQPNSKMGQEVQPNSKIGQDVQPNSKTGQEVQPVDSLDEDGLKSLLEEAITYKSPKDKDTKSALFQNLLIEVEKNDDSDQTDDDLQYQPSAEGCGVQSGSLGGTRGQRTTRKRLNRREVGVAERQRSGGSLQNLVYAGKSGRVSTSVSARQREGGSLPTNVNVQGTDADSAEAIKSLSHAVDICNYTSRAMLHVDSPISIPVTASKVASSVVNGVEQTPLQLHSNYNAVKSVIGGDTSLKSGTSSDNPTQQHVSTCFLPISPQQPSTGLRDTEYSTSSKSRKPNQLQVLQGKNVADDPILKAQIIIPGVTIKDITYSNISDLRPYASFAKDTAGECKIRSVDENGNALGTTNRVEASFTDRKVKRKKKNYRNIVNAENIEGHRWDEDVDSLLKYINSGSSGEGKTQKTRQSKIKSKEDEGRKQRRGKDSKLQKSNSLEEISKTKLEDLTSPSEKPNDSRAKPKKQVTLDDAQLEASSWQKEETVVPQFTVEKLIVTEKKDKSERKTDSFSDLQDSDFHVVKKKQRRRKRQTASYCRQGSAKASNSGYYGSQPFSSHYRRSGRTQENVHPRRKSASSVPPSDKSDSSDLDSVHSLPVSSTTPKPNVGKTSTSGGSTPQASYADITRSMMTTPMRTPSIIMPSSAASSGAGDEEIPISPEPVSTVTFVVPPPASKKDAMTDTDSDLLLLPVEEYPPLGKKGTSGDYFVEFTVKRGRINRENDVSVEETVILKNTSVQSRKVSEKPDSDIRITTKQPSVGDCKRPPVILLNRSGRSSPQQTVQVTFGFDVNEELLAESEQPTSELELEGCHHKSVVQCVKADWDYVMRLHTTNAVSEFGDRPCVQYYKPE